jgi:hypothetical protein
MNAFKQWRPGREPHSWKNPPQRRFFSVSFAHVMQVSIVELGELIKRLKEKPSEILIPFFSHI